MNSDNLSIPNPSKVRFLLVTANTGTVFERPELLSAWVNEFANLLRRHPADFIALHCQEAGGKDYERYMHILDPFIKDLIQIPEIATDFTRYRFYFDSDYTSQDTFTALGSAYFIRNNLPIEQWNFTTSSFQPVIDRQIFTGNLINARTLRKEKFPREFFSEAKWSRKGFTQTRWSINDFHFDMVNVHLFHDASNLLAAEKSPSIYTQFRKNALQYTLQRLPLNASDTPVPFAIFGDFNFRLDCHRLLEHIAENRNGFINKIKQADGDEVQRIIIKNSQNKTKLTVEKKEFNLHDDHDSFFIKDSQRFQMFDIESASFLDQLFEYEKTFPPSYPFSEEHDEARMYLRARCPAWCDRILLSHKFNEYIDIEKHLPTYNIVGEDVCMGDHKPVFLAFEADLTQLPALSPLSETTNLNTYRTEDEQNDHLPSKSPVTVTRKKLSRQNSELFVNENILSSIDPDKFNVHDYAIFVQPSLVPQWWFGQLRQRSTRSSNANSHSSLLWAKVRAVTYMTTLAHQTGSWYSDDQTENSSDDIDAESLTSEPDRRDLVKDIELNDVSARRQSDLSMPLRRSFSSIGYVKHDDDFPTQISRSHSSTHIRTTDIPVDLTSTDPSPSPPPSTPPVSTTKPILSSRVYRFLHCTLL